MRSLPLLSALLVLASCTQTVPPTLLPLPKEVQWEKGYVKAETTPVAVRLVAAIPEAANQEEAYRLIVEKDSIRVEAVTEHGVWNGWQTLLQLEQKGRIPRCRITDWPSFRVRGWMMDVGRTYVSLEELYREVDIFSQCKLNVLHLHLTEREAWRLESKKYPQLNAAQSMTRMPGLFYTQDQLRDLDDYCRQRGVTLVPELDMPGHSDAFERAMGFGMQTPQGKQVVKDLLDEAMEVFSSEYIHLGTDEVDFTDPAFVPEMVAHVRSRGRKALSWDPGYPYGPGEIDGMQLWTSRAHPQEGTVAVDSRLHYINHYDLFGDIIGLQTSRIGDVDEETAEMKGAVLCLWNDECYEEETMLRGNNLYANALALADRSWRGGGHQYYKEFGTILPSYGPAREDFLDFENRLLFFKETLLKDVPVPYVKQGDARWELSPVYPNEGNLEAVFPPEQGQWETARTVTGSGIYLRHVWGPSVVAGAVPNPPINSTVYARTRVYSEKEQEVRLLFETQNCSRSERDVPPPPGAWDWRHSRLWINGSEVLAPASTIFLNKGWNTVLVKLPVGFFTTGRYRLVKWMFTCAFTTLDGKNAADIRYFQDDTVRVHHRQVPVVAGKPVAIATVQVPEGFDSQWSFQPQGLPEGALQSAQIKDGQLFVTLDAAKITDLSQPFSIGLKAKGYEILADGEQEHRSAISVRTAGDDGVSAYRIPGLVTTHRGTLVATYDIRHNNSKDLQEDVDVGISRSTDGGLTWGPMIVALDMGEFGGLPQDLNGVGDPCILVDEVTGDLLLFAAWTHGGEAGSAAWWSAGQGFEPADTPQLMMTRSTDDGLTWSLPVNLTRQVKQAPWRFTFQGPGRGITMADGTLVVPFQHQEADRTPAAGIMYSKDRGATWHVHEYAKINTTESQVAEIEPGVLMLNMRDNRRTGRAVYVTRDLGHSWEPHASDGKLVEPVCMASLLKAGNLLLFSNPAHPDQRRDITVRVSEDGGVTWPRQLLLDEGTGWGYSCLSMIDPETVGILYESSQAHMTFQAIKMKDIR